MRNFSLLVKGIIQVVFFLKKVFRKRISFSAKCRGIKVTRLVYICYISFDSCSS